MSIGQFVLDWNVMFAILAFMAAFFVGQGMNAVMGRQGFGVFGNTIILSVGFFIGLHASELMRVRISGLEGFFAVGIAGAFVSLMLLTLLKRFFLSI